MVVPFNDATAMMGCSLESEVSEVGSSPHRYPMRLSCVLFVWLLVFMLLFVCSGHLHYIAPIIFLFFIPLTAVFKLCLTKA